MAITHYETPLNNKMRATRNKVASFRNLISVQTLFLLGVGVPTLVAIIYCGFIATDRYVSEAEFVVRGVSTVRAPGLEMLFRTFGLARTLDDTSAIQSYLMSRDALHALELKMPLRQYYSNRNADMFSRFPRFWAGTTFEDFYEYYKTRINVIPNLKQGTSLIRVEAFDPLEANKIATQLLALSESRVNQLNDRAHQDAVKFAQSDVDVAEQRLVSADTNLTSFRNSENLIDPKAISTSILETITNLSTALADTRSQIAATALTAPESPSVVGLKSQRDAYGATIATERAKLTGSGEALSAKVSEYERLTIMRGIAEKNLTAAIASLELARQDARRQQIYVEEVVLPNTPDKPLEPRRIRLIISVFVMSFALTSVVWLLMAGSKEHVTE